MFFGIKYYFNIKHSRMEIEMALKTLGNKYPFLTGECVSKLETCLVVLSLKKNYLLVREGQYANKAYFIVQGVARAFYMKDGKDISDWFAFDNDFICAVNSFFSNEPSTLNIELLEDSFVIEITKENFIKLSNQYPEIDRLNKHVITETMLRLQRRIVSMQFETAQQKYDNLLEIWPGITQKISLTHIASFLGISLETLSRVRNPKNRI